MLSVQQLHHTQVTEPAFVGVGPGFIGLHRFSPQRQLKWEAGFITEISQSKKDHSFRLALEFEF